MLYQGVDARSCEVEVDLDEQGVARETVVGLPDVAVRESLERVRSALLNSGYALPPARLLINLAPADQRKEGPVYDLPIAVGILLARGSLGAHTGVVDPAKCLVAGELALDGRIRPIRGAVALAELAASKGCEWLIVPAANAREAAVGAGLQEASTVQVLGVHTLSEVASLFAGTLDPDPVAPEDARAMLARGTSTIDFGDVKGQEGVKRAMVIAAAGSHNMCMLGPAGTGKTMMARALPGILPAMSPSEALEVTRIHSASGVLASEDGLVRTRPVRTPHHTSSPASLVGGGAIPRPGEVSLAHRGVLFLDELPEFPRVALETLRQPLEDGHVTIARAHGTVSFPARFMLLAAMNPTPRGDVAPGEVGQREMDRYLGKISGPLLDRIDLHVHAPRVPWDELTGRPVGTNSQSMREQVYQARSRAAERGQGFPNRDLRGQTLDEASEMGEEAMGLLRRAIEGFGLSARAYDKVRRIARTIADVEGASRVEPPHVLEAVQYRVLDRSSGVGVDR